jgi:hypothetical protein
VANKQSICQYFEAIKFNNLVHRIWMNFSDL